MCNETAVSQPGAWEVGTGFSSRARLPLKPLLWLSLVFSVSSECSLRKRAGYCCGAANLKTNRLQPDGEESVTQDESLSFSPNPRLPITCRRRHTHNLQLHPTWRLNKQQRCAAAGCKEFWETEANVKINMHRTKAGKQQNQCRSSKQIRGHISEK